MRVPLFQWRNDRPGYPGVAGGATQSGAPNSQFFEKTFRVLNGEQVNSPCPSLRTGPCPTLSDPHARAGRLAKWVRDISTKSTTEFCSSAVIGLNCVTSQSS